MFFFKEKTNYDIMLFSLFNFLHSPLYLFIYFFTFLYYGFQYHLVNLFGVTKQDHVTCCNTTCMNNILSFYLFTHKRAFGSLWCVLDVMHITMIWCILQWSDIKIFFVYFTFSSITIIKNYKIYHTTLISLPS